MFVRAYNGRNARWFQAATAQRARTVAAAWTEHDVTYTPVEDTDLGARIDAPYESK